MGTRTGTRVDRDAVPGAQPLEQHLGVRLPHAPEQQLAGVGAPLQPHGRVLGDEPGQRRGQPVLVGARGGLHRDRAAAGWAGPRPARAAGRPGDESVSPVSALTSRASAQMSPAGQAATVRSVAPSGEEMAPTRSSTSWSGCPRSARPCPETWIGMSGRSVPEKTRTSDTRPR